MAQIYHYPVWLRIWHAINAILIILLILSGISMQYANPDLPFIRFDIAVSMHNICGIALTINYLIFLIGNIASPNGRFYRLKVKGLGKRLWKQFKYYTFGVFKGEECPFPVTKQRKFNPLQKVSYIAIMYICIPILFLTGWALLFPETIAPQVAQYSGILLTALLHTIIGFIVSLFLLIHIYFCTFGKSPASNFKSILSGWQEAH